MKRAANKTASRTQKNKLRYVVVTTANRGIFIGQTDAPVGAETVVLKDGRNVFYFTAETGGFVGIASKGLFRGAKVGPAAERLELRNITAVLDASREAVETWSKIGWGS